MAASTACQGEASGPPSTDNASTVTRLHNQGATFNRMVVAAITLIVGVLVFNQILDSLPTSSAGIDRSPIVDTVASAFQLAPVVLIVLVAALVLAQVTGFGGE